MRRKSISGRIFDFLNILFFLCVITLCLYPLWYIFVQSLSSGPRATSAVVWPINFTLKNYADILSSGDVLHAFLISVLRTVIGTCCTLMACMLLGYLFSKQDMPFRKVLYRMLVITMYVSGGLIPTYLIVRSTGLMNTILVYIIPGAIWSYVLIITRAFFTQIDKGIAESARMDGAGEWTILFRLILPISMPILATIGLMYGVGHWNEYLSGVIYVNRPELRTLQVVLREVLSRNTEAAVDVTVPTKTLQMAGVVFTSVPIIVVYPFLQKYFTQGIMLGAIKG